MFFEQGEKKGGDMVLSMFQAILGGSVFANFKRGGKGQKAKLHFY